MNVLDEILGRKVNEDIPPVPIARTRPATALRRDAPKDKEEKKLRDRARVTSTVAHIVGTFESDEESIIPANAKPVDAFNTGQIPGVKDNPENDTASPSEPATGRGDELIPPTAALVAPDVTPKVFELIDPSQVPAPPVPTAPPPGPPTVTAGAPPAAGALDTILGRQQPSPEMPPITAESFAQTLNPHDVKATVAAKLVPASAGGSAMPEHREGDGRTIFNVARQFIKG